MKIMNNDQKISFATIVATGEQPNAALHIALVGDDIASHLEGSRLHIMTLAAALVKDTLDFSREKGGRLTEDMFATLIVRALGDAVNRPLTRTALKLLLDAMPAEEVDA